MTSRPSFARGSEFGLRISTCESSLPLSRSRGWQSWFHDIGKPLWIETGSSAGCESWWDASCCRRFGSVRRSTSPFGRGARRTRLESARCTRMCWRFTRVSPATSRSRSDVVCERFWCCSFAVIRWRCLRSCLRRAVIIQAVPHMRSRRSNATAPYAGAGLHCAASCGAIRFDRAAMTRFPSNCSDLHG